MKSLSEANTQFALDMFRQFGKSKEDNIFYSPLSITSAFAMLLLGCRENTALQIEKVGVSFDEKPGNVHHQFQKLLTELNKPTDAYELKIANRLYGEKTCKFLQDTSKSVQMMSQRKSFNFALLEDVQARVLEIPYKGKDLSMIVLLPNEIDGLQKKLIEWTSSQNMSKRDVDLYLPRFKVEKTYDLKDVLMAIGVVDVFSPQDADLSGMTGSWGLAVTKALHKSFVEVTEEGAEASTATGIAVSLTSPPYSIHEEFHCNHPFLFFIKQNKTNSILFFARVSSP
uniref:Serpin domain-containing protein n=1 Tax=Prolemur simus TaxID=1328070 RepID=A0A8C9AMC4_PROSS